MTCGTHLPEACPKSITDDDIWIYVERALLPNIFSYLREDFGGNRARGDGCSG